MIVSPEETAEAAFSSVKVKNFLASIVEAADIIVCSVDSEDLSNNEDFSETRLAGLVRQYN